MLDVLIRTRFSRWQYAWGVPALLLASYLLGVLLLIQLGAIEFPDLEDGAYDFIVHVGSIRGVAWLACLGIFALLIMSFELFRRRGINLFPFAMPLAGAAFVLIGLSAAKDPCGFLVVIPALGCGLGLLVLGLLRRARVHLAAERALRRWGRPAPYVLWVAVFVWMFGLSYHQFRSYASQSRDLGIFTQTVWLLSRGKAPENTLIGMHAFGDHAEYIDLAAVPLMWVWESPGSLLLLQALVVSAGTVGVFKFTRRKARSMLGALTAAALYPLLFGVQSAVMYDWNPETVAIGFVPWAFYLADAGKWKRAAAALVLIGACKENLLLFTAVFGLFTVFYYRRRGIGLTIFALSLAAFWVEVRYVFPFFGQFRHMRKGVHLLGSGLGGVAATVAANPASAVVYMVTGVPRKAVSLLHPFATLMFLPLLFPYTLLLVGTFLATRYLNTYFQAWSGYFHGGCQEVVLLLCVVMLVRTLRRTLAGVSIATVSWYVLGLAACSLALFLVFTPHQSADLLRVETPLYPKHWQREIYPRMLARIPDDASVAAQDNLIPHLAMRQRICLLEEKKLGSVEYIAVDKRGRQISPVSVWYEDFLEALFASPDYELIFHERTVYLFRRRPAPDALAPGS
jgi:uncharacterized membrane protein